VGTFQGLYRGSLRRLFLARLLPLFLAFALETFFVLVAGAFAELVFCVGLVVEAVVFFAAGVLPAADFDLPNPVERLTPKRPAKKARTTRGTLKRRLVIGRSSC
jgi:hypothetical protein